MSAETDLRELICALARSLFDRGLTGGSTGNISARTPDGGLLVTPTGSSFGRLDPARLDERRAALGLVPHANYVAQLQLQATGRGPDNFVETAPSVSE